MIAPRIVRRVATPLGDWPEHIPPVLRRIYTARGLATFAETQARLADLLPPDTLGGIDVASALLIDAIHNDRRVVIVGDFDCDGATGTAVGVRGLRMLGARNVAYQVPHRVLHGYGLTPALVDVMRPLQPDLIVTVDNGIASHAGVAAAKALGWKVLITDHHLPGATLPAADAIVNPNVPGDGFASKALAGVGVLFYLLLATRRALRDQGWFERPLAGSDDRGERTGTVPDLSVLLDLVAVGTVADMVPLDTNNRVLVSAGLRRLRKGLCQPGVRALADVAGRKLERLNASDIGFFIAPRINAAGRLDDMAIGIECLLTDDPAQAASLAHTLDAINGERRNVQQHMLEQAEQITASTDDAIDAAAVCVFNADWHPGVIGLVASKLKERLHRPVIAFSPSGADTDGEQGCTELRGSARSIPGFHIRDALAAVDATHPGLIARFGGHAMAAGMSIQHEHLATFIDAFGSYAQAILDPALLHRELISDGALQPDEMTYALAQTLRDAGPWGQGFPEPVFDGEFDVLSWRVVGERHLKLELAHADLRLNAIEFGGWTSAPPPERVRIAYRLEPDDWRDRQAVQLVVVHRDPA
jgi:single-stranded-DNA-specific exonuclease